MSTKVNLGFDASTVEVGFPTIPAGVYRCQVQEIPEIGMSKSGQPKVSVRFVILAPEKAKNAEGQDVPTKGKILFREYSLQRQAFGFFKELLMAYGIIKKDTRLTEIDTEQHLRPMVGRPVDVVVSNYTEEFPKGSGQLKERVSVDKVVLAK